MMWREIRLARVAWAAAAALLVAATPAAAQLVINEYTYDDSSTDDREFVELYNASGSDLDASGWSLLGINGNDGSITTTDTIPAATTIPAGGYYVIGQAGVPNLNQLASGSFQNDNEGLELRDPTGALIDGVIYEANKGTGTFSAALVSEAGGGWWGNFTSIDGTDQSAGRWRDGRDTNVNGRDIGLVPLTPGTSNDLPLNTAYSIADVDGLGLAVGSDVPGTQASFVLPKVIDPTVADGNNPNAIPPSPHGGNAIISWDPSGGGNMSASTELVTRFEIAAYLDTRPYEEGGAESTTYGIGTTGTFYNLPDPSGPLGDLFGDVVTANGNTGVGWLFEKEDSAGLVRLHLIDFGKGGDSSGDQGTATTPREWEKIASIDLNNEPSAWHFLSIDYDPSTGDVVAKFDNQPFHFTTETDLLGTFYVGYRESLAGAPSDKLRPATYDLVPEPSSIGLLALGALAAAGMFWRRRQRG